MPRLTRDRMRRYGVAVGAALLATLVYIGLAPLLEGRFLVAIYFLAVLVAAWAGGFGPALLTLLLGALTVPYFFFEPIGSLMVDSPVERAGLLLYLIVGGGIAAIGGSLRAAQQRERSERLTCDAERERLRVTLAGIGDGVIVTDTAGRVTLVNGVAATLIGWPALEAIGRPLVDVFMLRNERTGEEVEDPVARVLRAGTAVALGNHTVLLSRDGAQRPIDDSAAPVRDAAGRLLGVVLIFRDVSARRDAERRKDEFLAMLSHELRNPLVPLQNGLHLLAIAGHDPQVRAQAHTVMERQLQHLVRLVDELLDVSRLVWDRMLAQSNGPGSSEVAIPLPIPADNARPPLASPPAAPAAPADRPARRRILIVDDNTDAAASLAIVLRLSGHDVETAGDGPEALEAAERVRPDAVFLDIGLPGMDGFAVCRHLRRMPGFESVLIAALTGYGQDEDRANSRAAGFDLHLVKPVAPQELEELLTRSSVAITSLPTRLPAP